MKKGLYQNNSIQPLLPKTTMGYSPAQINPGQKLVKERHRKLSGETMAFFFLFSVVSRMTAI